MKKRVSVILALPLAACAMPIAQEQSRILAGAKSHCADLQVAPSDPNYLQCLDKDLVVHAMVAKREDDGSLSLVYLYPRARDKKVPPTETLSLSPVPWYAP